MTAAQLVSDLCEENCCLASQLMPTSVSSWAETSCNTLKDSYYKLLLKVNGFPPRQDFIGIELTIAYNYCYMCVLTKWMIRDAVRSVGEAVALQPNVILKDRTYSVVQPTVDDVVANCVERIKLFKKQLAPTYTTLERPNSKPSQQLLIEISSSWFPTEVKAAAISIISVYILDLLRDSHLSLASELSTTMLSFGESVLDSIIQAAQVNSRFAMLPFLPRDAMSQACSHVKDVVHVIAAIVQYRNELWSSSLDILQRCTSVELSNFCCFLRGLSLYRQNEFISSARVLSDLCERRDIHPVICYAATRLLGDCFSAQGKHHSAIQMYKRCLLKDFSLLMPLYHIAVQYRCLKLTDAEIESLQLLTKLLHNSRAESLKVNATNCLLFGVSRLLSYIAVEEDSISESQALYILAKRCDDVGRYEVSAEKYCQVLSSRNDTVSEKPQKCSNFPIPAVRVVYLESVRVHMKACQFQKVLTLCETFLSKLAWVAKRCRNESGSDRDASNCLNAMINESTLSKRCIKYKEDEHDLYADETVAARIALHHAEALLQLGQHEEAADSIEGTVKSIEFFVIDDKLVRPPPAKKTRSETGENIDVSERRELQLLLSDGYNLKARILSARDSSVNVLHWTRLAAALDSENVEKAYSLTQALIRLNRKLEASSFWLSKRGIHTAGLDCYQIDVAIKQRSSLSRSEDEVNSTGTSKELSSRYFAMDLEALNQLRATKHGF